MFLWYQGGSKKEALFLWFYHLVFIVLVSQKAACSGTWNTSSPSLFSELGVHTAVSHSPLPLTPLPVGFLPFLKDVSTSCGQRGSMWSWCPARGSPRPLLTEATPAAPPTTNTWPLTPNMFSKNPAARSDSWKWQKKKAFQNWPYSSAVEAAVQPPDLPSSVCYNIQLQILLCVFLFL